MHQFGNSFFLQHAIERVKRVTNERAKNACSKCVQKNGQKTDKMRAANELTADERLQPSMSIVQEEYDETASGGPENSRRHSEESGPTVLQHQPSSGLRPIHLPCP